MMQYHRTKSRLSIIAISLFLFLILIPRESSAEVEVTQAWVRSPPLDSKSASFYASIKNTGKEDDALIGIRCPLAEDAMLHETKMVGSKDNAHLRMIMVDEFPLPGHQTFVLSPGHAHIMLVGLKKSLHQGDLIKVELLFAHHRAIMTEAIVHGNLK